MMANDFRLKKRIIDFGPWCALAGPHAIFVMAMLGVTEIAAAVAGVVFMAVLTLNSAFAGLCYLFYALPFFLGESYHNWYFLLYLLAIVWLVFALMNLWRNGCSPDWRLTWPIVLLPLSAIISLPLASKELFLAISTQPIRQTILQLVSPSHIYPTFGVSYLGDLLLLCCLLPVATATFDQTEPRQKKQALAAYAILVIVYCASSLSVFYSHIFSSFLGVSMVGSLSDGIAGLAYNRAYFGTWMTWSLPLLTMAFYCSKDKIWLRYAAGLASILLLACLGLNGQKANLITIFVFIVAVSMTVPLKKKILSVVAMASFTLAIFAFDMLFANSYLIGKLAHFNLTDNYYVVIWKYAISLWDHDKILGIGSGSFAWWYAWAPDYITSLNKWFTWGNAHNQWMQLLAEQGLVGVACLASVFTYGFYVLKPSLRREDNTRQDKLALWGLLLVAVSSLWQSFLHIRSFSIWWVIIMAMAFSCVRQEKRPKLSKRQVLIVAVLFVAIFSVRIVEVIAQNPRPGFQVGFHQKENFGKDKVGYWIADRAVFVLPAVDGKRTIDLAVASFLPGLPDNPQKLAIWTDGEPIQEVTLSNQEWHKVGVALPAGGKPIVLHFKAKYSINPARQDWSKDNRNLSAVIVFEN